MIIIVIISPPLTLTIPAWHRQLPEFSLSNVAQGNTHVALSVPGLLSAAIEHASFLLLADGLRCGWRHGYGSTDAPGKLLVKLLADSPVPERRTHAVVPPPCQATAHSLNSSTPEVSPDMSCMVMIRHAFGKRQLDFNIF